ncbi:hypothetical protein ACQ4LE_004910 [Meloidogyne hapla]
MGQNTGPFDNRLALGGMGGPGGIRALMLVNSNSLACSSTMSSALPGTAQTSAVAYSSHPNPMNQQRGPQLSGGATGHGIATGLPESLTDKLLTVNIQHFFRDLFRKESLKDHLASTPLLDGLGYLRGNLRIFFQNFHKKLISKFLAFL